MTSTCLWDLQHLERLSTQELFRANVLHHSYFWTTQGDHWTIHNEPYRCPVQLLQTQNLIKVTPRMHNEMIHAPSRDKTALHCPQLQVYKRKLQCEPTYRFLRWWSCCIYQKISKSLHSFIPIKFYIVGLWK